MSTGNAQRALPQIAVGPGPADWAAEAVRHCGGQVAALDRDPVGLVWTGGPAERLREVLTAHPEISWVQLPLAGVETMVEAGVIDHARRWTSAKGAYAEPVAEHALALLLAGLRQLPQRARAWSWGEPAAVSLLELVGQVDPDLGY
jgi:phosphoglycerate dehydrogenase-like enzyme